MWGKVACFGDFCEDLANQPGNRFVKQRIKIVESCCLGIGAESGAASGCFVLARVEPPLAIPMQTGGRKVGRLTGLEPATP